MKTKLTILATLILLAVLSTSCDEKKVFCIKGDGPTEVYTLDLAEFHGIDLQVPAEVTLSQGPQEVLVTAQQNIVNNIELQVVDGIWEIDFEDCVKKSENIKIDITMPLLTFAQISGSGTVTGLTAFSELDALEMKICGSGGMSLEADCNTLSSTITGSGNMDLDMDCNSIETRITGSGDLDYVGTSPTHSVEITGSGNVTAFELATDDTDITVSGSGNCEVTVQNNLDVTITGSGDVFYKGTPGVDVNISGTGKLINAN